MAICSRRLSAIGCWATLASVSPNLESRSEEGHTEFVSAAIVIVVDDEEDEVGLLLICRRLRKPCCWFWVWQQNRSVVGSPAVCLRC